MAFDIATERYVGVLILVLEGRLDNEHAAEFELTAQGVLNAGERHLVLDLTGLDYLSNAGLRALGRLSKSLNGDDNSLLIAGARPQLRQVFDAAGAAMLFEFRADRAAALHNHPAGQGRVLAGTICRLLGVDDAAAAAPADPAAGRLAELAHELLTGCDRQSRVVRALAQGTQVMQRVAAAQVGGGNKPAATRKAGFWQRLFGRKR